MKTENLKALSHKSPVTAMTGPYLKKKTKAIAL